MRLVLLILMIAILSAVAEYFLPWWSIAVICFLVAVTNRRLSAGRAFVAGFCGIGISWLVLSLMRDIPNAHILSGRMARLLHLPGYGWFVAVTVLIGGLVGGLAALSGAMVRPQR